MKCKKLYRITTAVESENTYSSEYDRYNVVAKTAEAAINLLKKQGFDSDDGEFIDEIEVLGVIDLE